MENENNKEYVDNDKGIKIVLRTISPEVENGIVIAAYTDKTGTSADSASFAKGEATIVFSLLTRVVISMLDDCGFNLDAYIKKLQRISDERKKK